MRTNILLTFGKTIPLLLIAATAFAQNEVHEWGTFTSLVGSNGVSQDGMYHEDEALPDFVHGFGFVQSMIPTPQPEPQPQPQPIPRPRPCHNKGCFGDDFFAHNVITQKMETPVLYFYTDTQRTMDINVRFPQGVVTETFPAPVATQPSAGEIRNAANGDTTFHVDVLPQKTAAIPFADPSNIYVHARAVASNIVRSGSELEKFIFYRGIGRFQPRLGIASRNGGVSLDIARDEDRPSAIFLVHVNPQGDAQLMPVNVYNGLAEIPAADVAALEFHTAAPQKGIVKGSAMRDQLIYALTQSGLHADEAAAMINTWEHGYLHVPGLRFLYVLPRQEVDSVLPLTITPAPEAVTRVFVGRIEVLTDYAENAIVSDVIKLGNRFQASSLGRFAEPMLRRAKEVYSQRANPDFQVLTQFDTLIHDAATN